MRKFDTTLIFAQGVASWNQLPVSFALRVETGGNKLPKKTFKKHFISHLFNLYKTLVATTSKPRNIGLLIDS